MAQASGAMHVARVVGRYTAKSGEHREYVSHLLRRTFRADGKVRHETLANLSPLPAAAIEAVRASLAGKTLLVAGEDLEVTRSLPHGHVAAVLAQAQRLGLPNLLGPVGRQRDVAVALIVARVCRPGSKLATTRWWTDTTLAADLGLTEVSTDEAYAAMDWLLERQDAIEAALADRHLSAPVNPDRLALFDLSSSWMTGSHCPLAARGYSRDGKKGLPQIEYGLLTDPVGRPVAVRVVAGNTADPTAFAHLATDVRDRFGLTDLVLVGDRGMITKVRIEQLRDLGGLGWVTALRAPDVAALARAVQPLQMSLFDQANLAAIDAEAALDGIYVVRTSVPAEKIGAGDIVRTYKSLAAVERDFRSLKSIDLDLRPVYHYTETRVRAHVFLCMLAAYLVWHLRQAWRPLTFTDQDRPDQPDPVAPARRSAAAARKAATKTTTTDLPARSFSGLLDHLATLTRNTLRVRTDTAGEFDLVAVPTPTQRQAFDLLGATIPLRLQ